MPHHNRALACGAVAGLVVALVPFVLSPLRPVELEVVPQLRELPQNHIITRHHTKHFGLAGAESFAHDGRFVYTGLADGRIVRFRIPKAGEKVPENLHVETITRTGSDHPKCGNPAYEDLCGRPLGIEIVPRHVLQPHLCSRHPAYHQPLILVADTGLGLLALDLHSHNSDEGTTQVPNTKSNAQIPDTIVNVTQTVLATHSTTPTQTRLRLLNDLAVASDGTVFMTDTSHWKRRHIFLSGLEARSTGRLLRYFPSNGTVEEVVTGLLMPNGLTFTSFKRSLLICSTLSNRVLEYHVKGPKQGQLEAFATNLPGTPDNITPSSHPDTHKPVYFVGLTGKYAKPFSLVHWLAPYPSLRRWIGGLLVPPSMLHSLIPRYGLVAVLDEHGELVHTAQDPTGQVPYISSVVRAGDTLFLGSWKNDFVASVPVRAFFGLEGGPEAESGEAVSDAE